jgi:DNA polymerase II
MKKLDAFILTGEWEDIKGKNTLHFFGTSNEEGPIEIIIDNYKPVFFVDKNAPLNELNTPHRKKEIDFKTFDGIPVDAVYFNMQCDLLNAADILHGKNIKTYESDIDPVRRYLMEKRINAQASISGSSEKNGELLRFINPIVEPCEINPQFIVASIDIETGVKNNMLYSIAVHVTGKRGEIKKVFMLGDDPKISNDFIEFFPDETLLLNSFNNWFNEIDPDIIIGWHVIGFDLLFLLEKSHALKIPLQMARGKNNAVIRRRKTGGYFAKFPGRIIIDGPQALRMAFFTFEDFKLETVAQEMLGTGKTITSDKNKVAEIERLFKHNKNSLAEYNLQDSVLVTKIFQKTKLIELSVKRAQLSGLLMDQLGMMTAAFDHFMLPRFHRVGYAAPNVNDLNASEHAAGGYVMDPKPGLYSDVIVLDFKSLYPTIIQTFKIDPLSRLHSNIAPIETPNKLKFSSTENFLPDFITKLMEQRADAAKKNDKPLSQAIKILMNSFYGVMGSYGCRFYHPDLPTAITGTGQWLLLQSKKFLEEKGYEVLYGDTDSLFVQLNENDEKEKAGKNLAKDLNNYWKQRILNDFKTESFLEIKFEKYYRKFIITRARGGETGAKKRYAGMLLKNGEEIIEFVGMESVRSDWTKLAKEFQAELYHRVFNDLEIESWINSIVTKIYSGELDDKLIYKKRLRKDLRDYIKNIPPQVRAARMLDKKSGSVEYVMTQRGPIPIELEHGDIDYQHYIEKQVKPIADSILNILGKSFDIITKPEQLNFF